MGKNPYPTLAEWKELYHEKILLMNDRGFKEIEPRAFYRALFPEGSLQSAENDGKGNIIASQIRLSGRGHTKQWIVDDSLKVLDKVIGDEFGLIPPLSFFGKSHTKMNAHQLFAMAIDIDYVGVQQLKNMLKQFGNGVQLCPTYLVSSGKGVHLYYLLKEPIDLFHNREKILSALKEDFIRRLWNDTSSLKPDAPDITGIYQGFRCVGSLSKFGEGFPVKAWQLCDNRYTLEDIKASIPSCKIDLEPLWIKPKKLQKKSKYSLEEAKTLFPEWYQERVIEKKPPKKKTWVCNSALYDWWKDKILTSVRAGGRYYSIMALCAYGLKCGIPEKQIKQDAYNFLEHLESLTEDEDNHFTKQDVKDALRALRTDKKQASLITSRKWIENHTKVSIPQNKRNRRKQQQHLQLARGIRQLKFTIGEDVSGGGRPSKEAIVTGWRIAHPDGKKIDCHRETGLSRMTIDKWWNAPRQYTIYDCLIDGKKE